MRLQPSGFRLQAGVGALAVALAASDARAQEPPRVLSTVDADVVALGDTVRYTLQVQSETDYPDAPQPGPLPGFMVRGRPSVSTGEMQSIVNGVMSAKHTLSATWMIEATRTGTFTLGPPSVLVGGKRWSARTVNVRVVPAGQAPQRQRANNPNDPLFDPFSTLDPWKNMFRTPDDDQGMRRIMPNVPTDPRWSLPQPRGADAFLHAEVDKAQAVVGEQVTFSVYYYNDASLLRIPGMSDDHDASTSDFLAHPLLAPGSEAKLVGNAQIGDTVWQVRLVKREALFPLHAGDLEIGPMSVALDRRRAGQDPRRSSETLHVRVTEPPAQGRPPGYTIGDVGQFALSADVSPREAEAGGAIAVNVELSGTGNLPSSLTPPARADVEWLDPQVRDDLGARGDLWGGKRTFAFIARPRKPGTIDLGELTLPYWDPDARRYAVARAALGTIVVKPGAAPAASDRAEPEVLPNLPPPRTARAGARGERAHLADSPLFWAGLGLSPLAYAAWVGTRGATRRWRERRAARAASPETELKARIAAAKSAEAKKDARALDAATPKVLEAATLARVAVNVRGGTADDARARLEAAGVPADVAGEIQELLRACEAARFSPEDETWDAAAARWSRARALLDKLPGKAAS